MHEYSMVGALLDLADTQARHAHATSVRRLVVRVGDRAGLDTTLFRRAYETFRESSICASAELEIVRDGGDDVILQRIEMEVP